MSFDTLTNYNNLALEDSTVELKTTCFLRLMRRTGQSRVWMVVVASHARNIGHLSG